MAGLTAEQVEFYGREGYLVVEDAFDPSTFDLLRAELSAALAVPSLDPPLWFRREAARRACPWVAFQTPSGRRERNREERRACALRSRGH